MIKTFNEIINEVKNIAIKSIQDVKQHPELYKINFDEQKANEIINSVSFEKGAVRFADGITDVINNKIIVNQDASIKWGENYHKLVMLHELAHSFTHNVSNVNQGHCRSWFYWQYAFYKEAFGEYKAKELSKYNIARYAGMFNDSGIKPIEKFANRIGVEFDEIDFNLPNVKNYCSNLLKHSDEFVKVRYFLREINKTNSSLNSFEIQDEINESYEEVLKTIGKNFKSVNESLNLNEIDKEKILDYYPLLKELTSDEETLNLLRNHYQDQSDVQLENLDKEEIKKHLFLDVQLRVLNHQYDKNENNNPENEDEGMEI